MRALRFLDLGVLAGALPVFLVAGLPLFAWGVTAGAWLVQRSLHTHISRRAAAADTRALAGLLAVSMIGRGLLIVVPVLAAGLIERKAGLSAALLCVVLVTAQLTTAMVRGPFELPGGRR